MEYTPQENNFRTSSISVNEQHEGYDSCSSRNYNSNMYSTYDHQRGLYVDTSPESGLSYRTSIPSNNPYYMSNHYGNQVHSNFGHMNTAFNSFPTTMINYDSQTHPVGYDDHCSHQTTMHNSLVPQEYNNHTKATFNNTFSEPPSIMNSQLTRSILGGSCVDSFPEKLFRLLEDASKDGKADIAAFLPHGRAFAIFKPEKFITEIVPKYFRFSKITSFQRQLNLYGFQLVYSGNEAGSYYHTKFQRENPRLCTEIMRVKSKRKVKGS